MSRRDRSPRDITPGRVWSPKEGAACRECGLPIAFKQLTSGKWCPVELDGTDHWDRCKEWQVKQGIRAPGPRTMTIGISGPFRHDQPMWDGKGIPWTVSPPDRHQCGREWGKCWIQNESVYLRCACGAGRIERSL